MHWTKEQLYRRLEDAKPGELEALQKKTDNCPWRQKFHIQPKTGLLNDPNGFAFYNNAYHLFYQWFPFGPVHGLKYWYHLKSTDLVHWEDLGIGIAPDQTYDNYGAYSGTGMVYEDQLYLMYTGNHRDASGTRHPKQVLAVMNSDARISKLEKPVITDVPKGYTEHFRDPKIWQVNHHFYAVIGAQRVNKTGAIVLYESPDLKNWHLVGEVHTTFKNFGYMWECPDYFELDGKGILMFSPQGVEPERHRYHNIYQTGVLIGKPLDIKTGTFNHEPEFHELDCGFDFYAAQTMQDGQGRRLLIGWMGLPDLTYPTDTNGWAHCLTLPRVLNMKNGKLYQQPVDELKMLRKERHEHSGVIKGTVPFSSGKHIELSCKFTEINTSMVGVNVCVGDGEKTVIAYDLKEKKIMFDRHLSGLPVAPEYGSLRTIPYDNETINFQIFVDTSSVEVFINDGEYVLSARIFPTNTINGIELFTENGQACVEAKRWELS